MKAWVLNDIGNITYSEHPVSEVKPGEVLIRVAAAGICGSDIPRIYETGAHMMPIVPGHEFSGTVERVSDGVDPSWIGRRVAVYPKIACGKCAQCQKGHLDLCTDYDYIGSRRNGAFAEYVSAPATNLMELPDHVDHDEAAMIEPLGVAANAVRTYSQMSYPGLTTDTPVAVCGLGTIGLMTVMFLQASGFRQIYVIGNKDSQRERASMLGIPVDRWCNSRSSDAGSWLKEVTRGGVYGYFECTGRNESIEYGLTGSAPRSCMILVGNPASDMSLSRDVYWQILRKQMKLCGIWNSNFPDDWQYVVDKLASHEITPQKLITHRLPIGDLERGLHIMRDKSEDYCKVMMIN